MYTIKRIGIVSAIRIGGILSAAVVVVPIIVLLLINSIFKLWDIIIPPELIVQTLSSLAFWAAIWGGIVTGVVVLIYNISAHFFGGIQLELKLQQPPRKSNESIDIE